MEMAGKRARQRIETEHWELCLEVVKKAIQAQFGCRRHRGSEGVVEGCLSRSKLNMRMDPNGVVTRILLTSHSSK